MIKVSAVELGLDPRAGDVIYIMGNMQHITVENCNRENLETYGSFNWVDRQYVSEYNGCTSYFDKSPVVKGAINFYKSRQLKKDVDIGIITVKSNYENKSDVNAFVQYIEKYKDINKFGDVEITINKVESSNKEVVTCCGKCSNGLKTLKKEILADIDRRNSIDIK